MTTQEINAMCNFSRFVMFSENSGETMVQTVAKLPTFDDIATWLRKTSYGRYSDSWSLTTCDAGFAEFNGVSPSGRSSTVRFELG